ncbi:MAG: DUF1614 domain-containing protein [Elusimicrobia bacterium]|nr:DUF1614 domain-containing protein [Elusimicrobiota bacterium]
MHYVPWTLPIFLAFWLLVAGLVIAVEIGILRHVFEIMGVPQRYMLVLVALCLLGSYVNIPVAQLSPERLHAGEIVQFYGMLYVVPVLVTRPGTIIAVNLGGAVIPFILSLYLVAKHRLFAPSLLGVAAVTLVVHQMASPVPGVGIAVPVFVPPLVAALAALAFSRGRAGPLAYVSGSLGTLVGADLLNLDRIQGLGAPIASIGGAGKFDGIFISGIVAVVLAGLLGPRPQPAPARL